MCYDNMNIKEQYYFYQSYFPSLIVSFHPLPQRAVRSVDSSHSLSQRPVCVVDLFNSLSCRLVSFVILFYSPILCPLN